MAPAVSVGDDAGELLGCRRFQPQWTRFRLWRRKPDPNLGYGYLVLRLARETGWGYTRILGELRKLGITKISRATVLNILREHGLEPGPKRGEGTWDESLKRHAATLWACDFFSKKLWTTKGLVEIFELFFIQVGSRRVHLAGMTAHSDGRWMA